MPRHGLLQKLLARYRGQLAHIDDFFADAAAGTLPGFSLVEPNYLVSSEEDPQNIAPGEQFSAKVINAVMTGPAWKNTLLIWTFDEHGGYYDHVVPPRPIAPDNIPPAVNGGPSYTGVYQYGFPVPFLVGFPSGRPKYRSPQRFDNTRIFALVEKQWKLPATS